MITTLDVKPDLANAQNEAAGASKFCPGCGHGMILKTLAKTIDELELKEKTMVAIKTKVSSEVAIDAEKWVEKIGTAYPLKVVGLIIATQEKDNKLVAVEKNNEVLIEGDANKISGSFEIESSDKKLAFVIDCEEKKEEDN